MEKIDEKLEEEILAREAIKNVQETEIEALKGKNTKGKTKKTMNNLEREKRKMKDIRMQRKIENEQEIKKNNQDGTNMDTEVSSKKEDIDN